MAQFFLSKEKNTKNNHQDCILKQTIMKQFSLLLIGILVTMGIFAQKDEYQERDEEAKVILDKLGKELKGYKTMVIDFKLTIKSSDLNETHTGKAYTKGDKFFYTTEERDVYSDGESVWTYVKEDDECYIDAVEDLDGGINPSEIMTIWDKNFKYKYFGKKDGITEIRLYPTNPKESKYHTVILKIDEAKNQLKKITIKTKDAVTIQFKIEKITPNVSISDNKFEWVKSKHPNVEEIDNR